MNGTATKTTKRRSPTRKVQRVDQMAKLQVFQEPETPKTEPVKKPKDKGTKPDVFYKVGIEFRNPGENWETFVSPVQIGATLLFISQFRNVENAKTTLDAVGKLINEAADEAA